jgi:putative membrane protein
MAHMDGMWMDMMWWMWIPSVIVLGALIAPGVWAVRRFSEPRGSSDARRVLEERFARGEIDADEFRTRLATLEGRSS